MTTTDDPREDRDDLGMARRADLWPMWPVLPVKRPQWETGVLIEDGTAMVAMPVVHEHGTGKVLHTYDSLEALFADGWRVD